MGKVFVKSPVESPDDLLAKESRLGQFARVGLDATQGAVNLTRPRAIQSAADLVGVPINIARYFMQGKANRQLSPTEQAYQKLIAGRDAQEQFARDEAERKREEEMAENFRRLEVMSPSDDRKIAPLPEVSGLPFSQQRRDSKQALADAQAERKEMYEKLQAAQRLPLQEEAANAAEEEMYQRNLQRVQEENIRAALRGQKQKGKNQAQVSAGILQRISDANPPATPSVDNTVTNVATTDLAPMAANVKTTIDRDNANERIREMAGLPAAPAAPAAPVPNVEAIANDPSTNAPPVGGVANEVTADNNKKAKFNEAGLNDNSESTQEALQQQTSSEEEPIDFTKPPTGLTQDATQTGRAIPTGRAFDRERLPDGSGRWQG